MAAVLTADLVHSTRLPASAHRKLVAVLEQVLSVATRFEFYRGDSFQVYFVEALPAFRVLLQVRLAARRLNIQYGEGVLDVRCAIGLGPVGPSVTSVRTATGPAFLLSGRSFDSLNGSAQLMAIACDDAAGLLTLDLLARFTDYVVQQLTGRQSEVLFELLQGYSQLEAAQRLKKAPATINQHARTGNWAMLERLLSDYEAILSQYGLR
jgi:DNA-binding CsgD family transcriptional regulator